MREFARTLYQRDPLLATVGWANFAVLAAMQAIVRTVYATAPHKFRPDEMARRAFEIAAAMEQERQRRVHQGA